MRERVSRDPEDREEDGDEGAERRKVRRES